ncbi:MAG: amidohydrolase, partial [Gemmatimonadota bacterium]|nr:amidohydrolase [Gemmatimonadota bacterium]
MRFRLYQTLTSALSVGALSLIVGCMAEPEVAADLVLQHGKVVTVDDANPEGEAIAILGDTILAVGSDRDIARYVGRDTKVIDLSG